MILTVILLFSLAALIGAYIVFVGLRYHRGSLAMGLGHAAVASLGLTLLVIHIFHERVHHILYNDAAILFVLTLAGGLVLLALREGRKPPPMIVVGLHAAMALFALFLLIKGFLRY
jgi:hypothetical protein